MLRNAYQGLLPAKVRKMNRLAFNAISDRLQTHLPPRRLRAHISPLWLDFVVSGRDQLEFNVELAGLSRTDHVLDIGCGCGRFALPLSDYLSPAGAYEGFDVAGELIAWCTDNISKSHRNFRFQVADVISPWTPNGGQDVASYRFPYPSAHFNFAYAGSLFTHLSQTGAQNYLRQTATVLKPGAKFVCTWLLFNRQSEALFPNHSIDEIWPHDHGTYRTKSDEFPEGSIAFDEMWVRQQYKEAGLLILDPIRSDATYSTARIPDDRKEGRHLYYAQSIIAVRLRDHQL
jgi:SAM-dependent methyltransferase